VPKGRVGRAPLLNQLNAIGVDFQCCGSLADENRINSYIKHICGTILGFCEAPKKGMVARKQSNCTFVLRDQLKAAIFLEFTGNWSTNVHSKNMPNLHEVIQLMRGELMLFYHEVAPVRGRAGQDNAGEWIAGQNLAVPGPHKRNIESFLHYNLFTPC
jgi:hypothetical protein